MEGGKVVVANRANTPAKHVKHGDFEYSKHLVLPRAGNQCTVAIMEIPPQKTAYPCHYHIGVTEVFYIIRGRGRLEIPEGEREVSAGDVIVFPPGEAGAHKLWNASDSEPLVYLDCDTVVDSDVVFYPHSDKVGLIVNGEPVAIYRRNDDVDYYEGE